MWRHVILLSVFCFFGAASFTIVNPGPAFPATKGEVWPKPWQQTKEDTFFKFIPTSFTFTVKGETCEILRAAIERYTYILLNTHLTIDRHANQAGMAWMNVNATVDENYKGTLQELQINLSAPCESYPHLDMDEKYSLNVSAVSTLNSDSIWGVLRGMDTFAQMFYFSKGYNYALINTTQIVDYPKYPHRGLLIDTSRHYLLVSNILKTLDAMEMNKMNVLHWHIVDDQSFPYQSKKFPDLSKAAYDAVMIYDEENINYIVNYARNRGIRVIPEFDVPGHTSSWGVAYPNILSKCYRFDKEIGLGPMDPTKNVTYKLIGELFQEVQERFPDKYFHVGGDEVDMDCWKSNPEIVKFMEEHNMTSPNELHALFMSRVIPLLGDRSKPIVWQEVFDEGVSLPSGTIVQVWKSTHAREMLDILNAGYKIVYSSSWYLDHINGGGDWIKFYSSDPRKVISGYNSNVDVNNILGGEACMWGEVVDDTNVISRVWPRASAVAEILWSGSPQPGSERFYYWSPPPEVKSRLEEHACRMNRRGIFSQPPNGPGFCIKGTL